VLLGKPDGRLRVVNKPLLVLEKLRPGLLALRTGILRVQVLNAITPELGFNYDSLLLS